MKQKCPSCLGEAESIGPNRYECPYCGEQFTAADIAKNNEGMQYDHYQVPQYQNAQPYNPQPQMQPQMQNFSGMNNVTEVSQEDCGMGLKIICLLLPIIGIILYFAKKGDEPVAAKSCLNWSLAGFVVAIILGAI